MSSTRRKTHIAWIALIAVFFSGISSALATLYFQDRPDIIAAMCTSTGISKMGSPSDGSGSSGGNIYCSQCLGSAAQQAVVASSFANLFAMVAVGIPMPEMQGVLKPSATSLPPPPRGPPAAF